MESEKTDLTTVITKGGKELDVLKAIRRMNKLNSDVESLTEWLATVQFNSKPVNGRSWVQVSRAINEVIGDLAEERDVLAEKINSAVAGIIIEID